jgi:hypothetical protein
MGPARYFDAQIEAAKGVTDLRRRYDKLGFREPNSRDDFHAI